MRVATHTTQHNTTQHNTTQHNTTQHNTTQHAAGWKKASAAACVAGQGQGGGAVSIGASPRTLKRLFIVL